MSTKKLPRTEALSAALNVAYSFVNFGSYQGSESRALSALKRRCTGWEREALRPILEAAIELYNEAIWIVRNRAVQEGITDFAPLAKELFHKHPLFEEGTIEGVLDNMYIYHCLR